MILLLILISVFTFITVHLWRGRQKNPKGPFPLPIVGNIHQLVYYCWKNGGVVEGLNEFEKAFGKVFTIWMGPLPVVFIGDFDVAHESHVKRANVFGKRFAIGGMNYIREGRGLLASNGEFWQEHRRFALHTLRNFGLGRNIMEEKIMDEFTHRFEDFGKTHAKNGGIEVHAGTFFDLLVGSIINQLLVSERFEQDDKEFEKLKNSIALSFESLSFFDVFCPLPILKSKMMEWRTRTVLAPFDYIYELTNKNIRERVKAIERGEHEIEDEGTDFVDAFLYKMEKDKREGVDSTFNLETLAIDLYDLWIGGQETTSTTLSWACACLLNHPEVVRELRKELLSVTGGNRTVSLTDRPNTPFLTATVNEVQRIASILSVNLFRKIEEDTVIDGQPLAAGTVLTTQMSMIHTDETHFKDHTTFRPQRFLENNNLEKKLIPFGIGKRSCLGESLARAELYLIIGNMVLQYNLEVVDGMPPIKTPFPFSLAKRPPSFKLRFVPVDRDHN